MTKEDAIERAERKVGIPLWAAVFLVGGGVGGLGLGSAQFARGPSDLGDKIDAVSVQMGGLTRSIDVLTTKVEARDKSDDRERARIENEIDDLKTRVKHLEDRKTGR